MVGKVTGVSAETSPGEADDYQETERGVYPWDHGYTPFASLTDEINILRTGLRRANADRLMRSVRDASRYADGWWTGGPQARAR